MSTTKSLYCELPVAAMVWEQDTRPDPERPGVVIVSTARITINALATTDIQDNYGKFPEYERIVPSKTSGQLAQFNASYLYDIGKAKTLLTGGGKGEYFSIMHNGDSAAMVHLTDRAFALLMPMRGESQGWNLPEWFTGKPSSSLATERS